MQATIPSLPGIRTWRSAPGGLQAMSWPARTATLVAVAGFCALVQGPTWRETPALAAVNLAVSVVFLFNGLGLGREPGQRGTAWALILTGVIRSMDYMDAWNGAWPAFVTVFGGVDRVFGIWALLRYPNSSLTVLQRR